MNTNYVPGYPKKTNLKPQNSIPIAEILAQHTLMFRALQVACQCKYCPDNYCCLRFDYDECHEERLNNLIAEAMSVLDEQDQVKVEAVYKNIRKMRTTIKL